MDEMKQTEQNEYPFIREKIVSKRKSRLKRFAMWSACVVVLAVLFGVVSRLCFVASEPLVNKLLGLSPTPVPMRRSALGSLTSQNSP